MSARLDRQKAFSDDVRKAIKETIAHLPSGTVGISADCLWANSVSRISRSMHSPVGTNALYYVRQAFDEVVSEKQFSKFVYQD